MTKWTKGPWTWRGDLKNEYEWEAKSLDGPNGEDVLRTEDVYPGYAECGEDIRIFVSPAAAHLIAAAPELYEALKACHLQMLQSNNQSEYAEEANQMAISALAKARGESND